MSSLCMKISCMDIFMCPVSAVSRRPTSKNTDPFRVHDASSGSERITHKTMNNRRLINEKNNYA